MFSAVELVVGVTLAGGVAGAPMSLISPVVGLSSGDLAGAMGAFAWAVAALLFAKVVDRRQQPHVREETPSVVPLPDVEPSSHDFPMAA